MAKKTEEVVATTSQAPTNLPAEVQKETAAKPTNIRAPKGYELVNWTFGPRIHAGKHGIIDLTKLSPARAGQLVDAGFKYLKRK